MKLLAKNHQNRGQKFDKKVFDKHIARYLNQTGPEKKKTLLVTIGDDYIDQLLQKRAAKNPLMM